MIDGWCFGIVNNRLAEVYFKKKNGKAVFQAHAYIRESDYKTKQEKRYIEDDCKKVRLVWRKGEYKMVKGK